jgi:demethylmenaquinone methyltransferase/2-methoxy-6-polyprenyl-1,4-benzoquinol methylase
MENLRNFFEKLALEWDAAQPDDRDEIIHKLIAPFDHQIKNCNHILDAGTGTGALIPILKARYPNSKVVSFDLAHQMLRLCHHRVPQAPLLQCDVHYLALKGNHFDLVICHNSFPHFWYMSQALLSFKRVLRKNGKLLILHDISRERVNSIHQNAKSEVIHHDLLPDASDLGKLLNNCGFETRLSQDTDEFFIVFAEVAGTLEGDVEA